VVPPDVYEHFRKDIHSALFLVGVGTLERSGKVLNVKTHRISTL
jgi:error-prone DNA polymerase